MIDELTIQRVKDSAKILDVVQDYVQLKRAGVEYTGCCPFHEDRHTGSFMVNPNKNIAHCFPCDKTWDPIGFIMDIEGVDFFDAIRMLGKKFGVYIDESGKTPPQKAEPRPLPPPLPKRTWPLSFVKRNLADGSDALVRWLMSLPWDASQRARLPQVLAVYFLGHSHFFTNFQGKREEHDFTVFWQIDENFTLHDGHFMKYYPPGHPKAGHRMKEKDEYNTTWLHARMKYADPAKTSIPRFDEAKEDESHCLFGQHLMASNPNAVINIVESEKTALVMSVAYGCSAMQLWMACAGLGNLTNRHELLKPLIEQKKTIVLYPDHDGIDKWKEAAKQIGYKWLSLNTEPVTKWWTPEDGEKADIADVVLRSLAEHRGQKPVQVADPLEEWIEKNPNVKTLIEKLELEAI